MNLNIPNLNSSGQSEMVFRLLIGAIMGLAILVTIISMIGYFGEQEINVSEARLYEGFQIALENLSTEESPEMVVMENLKLKEKSYSAFDFALEARMPELYPDCIRLTASPNLGEVIDNRIEISSTIKTDIYYKCISQTSSCSICCIISFGQEISPGEPC